MSSTTTEEHDDAWFSYATNEILVASSVRPFGVSIEAIDDLERRAVHSLEPALALEARKSCADLRLDVAINTHQDFNICASLYQALVTLGVEPSTDVIKAVILAREWGKHDQRALTLLASALARAQTGSVPRALMDTAKDVLLAHGHR